MRNVFLAGGFLGFALCVIAGASAHRAPDLILRDAAFGCLAGAVLMRWLWGAVVRSFREALTIRRRAVDAAAAAAAAAAAPAAPESRANPQPAARANPQPVAASSPSAPAHPSPARPRAIPVASPKPVATR